MTISVKFTINFLKSRQLAIQGNAKAAIPLVH